MAVLAGLLRFVKRVYSWRSHLYKGRKVGKQAATTPNKTSHSHQYSISPGNAIYWDMQCSFTVYTLLHPPQQTTGYSQTLILLVYIKRIEVFFLSKLSIYVDKYLILIAYLFRFALLNMEIYTS